jgi:hypothetical protein
MGAIALAVLFASVLPWLFGGQIDRRALDYGIARYDEVIDAIEEYRDDHGEYPPSLDALVPDYLADAPGIFIKFGERLTYEPKPSIGCEAAPFTFELYGHDRSGIHGQILRFCPEELGLPDKEGRDTAPERINERWIWLYSSAL